MKDAILSVDCKKVVFFFLKIGLEERKSSEFSALLNCSCVQCTWIRKNTDCFAVYFECFFSFFFFFFCYVNKRAGAKKRQTLFNCVKSNFTCICVKILSIIVVGYVGSISYWNDLFSDYTNIERVRARRLSINLSQDFLCRPELSNSQELKLCTVTAICRNQGRTSN